MEVEPSPPEIAKKLWSIARVVFFMLRKGVSKSKLMLDLHMLLKRGKLAGKALGNHMLHHHYAAMTCRSNDVHLSFVSPREYEFSCSNSPVYPSYYYSSSSARRNKHHQSHLHLHHPRRRHSADDDDVKVVQKVLEMLNKETVLPAEASPLLPGFGRSPMVRQLRVTDSPFPLKDEKEDNAQVDKAAEEFIKKFYRELMRQKKMAPLESPSPYHIWAS
ncbi:uncharacterized protein LOC127805862 [Diospyros lotus]|uniref:uncharacterized protein LOC127805862 n=1 Tax=Diospyros lotus TaxID=55363 RepID=UPI00225B03FF|nr:uncharacterized protein LOC127805862 [Diospyros lotus]